MTIGSSIIGKLRQWWAQAFGGVSGNAFGRMHGSAWPRVSSEELPLRTELFSSGQMELHGNALAVSHQLVSGRAPDQLLARLAENENVLIGVCNLLTDEVTAKRRITPAGGWLLDNFYLIEEQILTAKRHLPKGYSRELPRLARGPSAGRPRVYDIALEIISHGDGRVDTDGLRGFVTSYQSVTSLKLGELWAIPIMLRLAIIENLRRVSVRIADSWSERSLAASWADQMIDIAETDPKSLILVIADMARSLPPLMGPFVAELARRLQGRGPALALPLTWIEQRLSESGLTIEQLVQSENQQQAANQVSISNSIGSLRVLEAVDWREFVESMSVVEQTLLEDPSGIYAGMDFGTRDRYRHATEKLAKQGALSEVEVARKAVELAQQRAQSQAATTAASATSATSTLSATPGSREAHVGYYLIDKGLPELQREASIKSSRAEKMRAAAARSPVLLYLGPIGLLTVLLAASILWWMNANWISGGVPYWALWPLGVLLLLATGQLSVALVNWQASLLVQPHPLPRMDFSKGIPESSRTLVVVPTMLTSAANVEDLIEGLEVRFLANRDAHLHFALLTDFLDAKEASLPEDEPLLRLAQMRIEELNRKYADQPADGDAVVSSCDSFFLFHRSRRWNPQEKVWMGYERKRGKLADLNALLRSQAAGTSAFSLIVGNTAALAGVKYVITLDTDTQLPRDAARELVGAMSHPLNRPFYDVSKRRVTEGYGILQPGVAISLPGTNRSRYARLYGGEPGIDPYTRAVSDVYQDVFGEGSFVGKGIYDVDAFEQALGGRLPENRILSHDLLEGCFARAGLLSDVQLYEDCPPRYSADVSRRHRWIRGDWQLASWLLSHVPAKADEGHARKAENNPLSTLSQWKLSDNLRRSLVPAALTTLFVVGWLGMRSAFGWTLCMVGILLLPAVCSLILDLVRKPDEVLLRQHATALWRSSSRRVMQTAFELACLPYEAYYSCGAILRTHWRLLISHRRLLEWSPSSEVERKAKRRGADSIVASVGAMWIGPVLAVATAVGVVSINPLAMPGATPILLMWFASPLIAWWVSRPLVRSKAHLSQEQTLFLRMLSRRTWEFFHQFVVAGDHWLPPDNVQARRADAVAHRTSPTNMGLALLANLAARDFGYIPTGLLIERTANTLGTMQRLERYRGHFYNWYDTQTLQPLPPLYVSSVDSGNLAGHLLTLRAGLLTLADERILNPRVLEGLDDTLRIFVAEQGATDSSTRSLSTAFQQALDFGAATVPVTLVAAHVSLERLANGAAAILMRANQLALSSPAVESAEFSIDVKGWAVALVRQCREALDEIDFLAPWLRQSIAPRELGNYVASLASSIGIPSLRRLAVLDVELFPAIQRRIATSKLEAQREWLLDLQRQIAVGSARARARIAAIDDLAAQADVLAHMEYDFLYDSTRHLLRIGYDVSAHRADAGYYDLLASEARLCTFVAIAQGQIPQESWFALGRLLTSTAGEPVLLSWSGSMFEYLMPQLVMPNYDNTLLDQTGKAAVARQIEYGRQRGVPWGMSECGYNTVDGQLNYQYRAFGVPGLGLKRGLSEDLVIAPYASVMALMVAPEEACSNLQRLAGDAFLGKFGFFEAIDYTPVRQSRGQISTVVRSFMAHHQGMSLLSLTYLLLDRPMQRRFESDRLFQASMLLLQERIPRSTMLFSHTAQRFEADVGLSGTETPLRVFPSPDTPTPEVQLLSNGRYHVMLTNAGGGYSRWKDLAVTRWHEDATRDNWGSFCYIRELGASEAFWSTSHQPTLARPESYEAIFSEGRAEFRRRDAVAEGADAGAFETHTEIVVSPEDDIELRRVRITNRSRLRREIEVTSYAEVVIAGAAEDALHPAFSNLFVQTSILPEQRAILCARRPRSPGQQSPWMLHQMAVRGAHIGEASYETDRARFIGRSRNTAAPLAMSGNAALSGSEGSVLDPIVAIRHRIALDAEESIVIDIVTGIAETREIAVSLIDKYRDKHLADRVFDVAWTHSQIVLQQLNANETDTQLYARLASSIIYANASLRADAAVLLKNRRGQSGLWGYAISGDLPIVLLQITDAANIDLARQLVQAHAYWRLKGLAVDLVIWNEDHAGYRQRLQEQIMALIASGVDANVIDRPGGVFVRPAEQISSEDRILFHSVARAVILDTRGTLAEQLDDRNLAEARVPMLVPTRAVRADAPAIPTFSSSPRRDLILSNGLGGFAPDGREYVIELSPGKVTPAPWSNVLANPFFGSIISESGVAYTWSENAHEFRLTPWHNDPVSDANGEVIYLRDEESGSFWSPTPAPCHATSAYTVRHGFGYSVFETVSGGIRSELWVYVALDASIKFSVLKVKNESGRPRRLSATGYVEWVLGDLREKSAMHVSTEIAAQSGALYARNPYSTEFAERVAFFDVDDPMRTLSGDRAEFVGRNGSLRNPAAMQRTRLSGKVGAGLDPCGAIQVSFELQEGQEREIVFRLGVGSNVEDASKLVRRFRGPIGARSALEAVKQHWLNTLTAVQVETPDPALNVLANGWLVYQTLACRIWARSGYYQSGGAFGFRDQLQDAMALIHTRPELLRTHILLCASRQFREGDVQHWWHPPSGRGVRTRCSDDYLWLPLAVCRYVHSTADTGVLEELVGYLEGRAVNPEDDSYYDLPGRSSDITTLYEHCMRAIRHGLRFGEHGLPLMGTGDWNDGMNLVGMHDKGESIWLGFFLCEVLREFASLARRVGDEDSADLCAEEGARLRQNIEQHGWDGDWYRRAYFDDGRPLGSASNAECRIDSISQSWSVLSATEEGVGNPVRSRQAMQAVNTHLVRRDHGLIQLLDPPFDTSDLNPGYIRGYVPGVRENGGQYTHAAIWTTMAFAALGEHERAWELFRMINPVNHALTPEGVTIYKVEPYVVTADVYAMAPHTGRGGWSWYTGSAGWMYRLIVESLLGLRLAGESLSLAPCLPADWQVFNMTYRYRETPYFLSVTQERVEHQTGQKVIVSVDGVDMPDGAIPLVHDRQEHQVVVRVLSGSRAEDAKALVTAPETPVLQT
ncbi:MAG TPA: glucoamylase family protein [Rhodocyclaceae bacterium]|nr:glucoamylase family protein [Rhodocyclaceae bacterium]